MTKNRCMTGTEFDEVLTLLEKSIRAELASDEDGKINEKEFLSLCKNADAIVDELSPDFAQHLNVTGQREGAETLVFKLCYYDEKNGTAYDRAVQLAIKQETVDFTEEELLDFLNKWKEENSEK